MDFLGTLNDAAIGKQAKEAAAAEKVAIIAKQQGAQEFAQGLAVAATTPNQSNTFMNTLTSDIRRDPASYIRGVDGQLIRNNEALKQAEGYQPIRQGEEADAKEHAAYVDGLAAEARRLADYKSKLQHGTANQPRGMEVMYMNPKTVSDVKYDMDMDKARYNNERQLH